MKSGVQCSKSFYYPASAARMCPKRLPRSVTIEHASQAIYSQLLFLEKAATDAGLKTDIPKPVCRGNAFQMFIKNCQDLITLWFIVLATLAGPPPYSFVPTPSVKMSFDHPNMFVGRVVGRGDFSKTQNLAKSGQTNCCCNMLQQNTSRIKCLRNMNGRHLLPNTLN